MNEIIQEYLDVILAMIFGAAAVVIISNAFYGEGTPMANVIKAYVESLIQ